MDQTPAIAETVGVIALDVKSLLGVVLKDGHCVIAALEEQFDRLGAKLGGVETVEENRTATALGVADFAREDGFFGGITAVLPAAARG